jgi:hypothetical protein
MRFGSGYFCTIFILRHTGIDIVTNTRRLDGENNCPVTYLVQIYIMKSLTNWCRRTSDRDGGLGWMAQKRSNWVHHPEAGVENSYVSALSTFSVETIDQWLFPQRCWIMASIGEVDRLVFRGRRQWLFPQRCWMMASIAVNAEVDRLVFRGRRR